MLLDWGQLVLTAKPETEEEFVPLLDQLARQLVNLYLDSLSYQNPEFSQTRTFANIPKRDFDAMCNEVKVKAVGKVEFADSWSLFGDVEDLPNSFKTQSLIINAVNVDEVITIVCSI